MKKRMKRLFALLLVVACVTALLCGSTWATYVVDSGWCGNNVTWSMYSNGTIVIDGKGAMYNYYPNYDTYDGSHYIEDSAPWYPYWESIRKIVVKKGITTVGRAAFVCFQDEFSDLHACSVSLPEGLTRIEDLAFHSAPVTDASIPASVRTIGWGAFEGDTWDGKIFLKKLSFRSGSKLKTVGEEAFYGTNVKEIRFPPSLDSLGNGFTDAGRISFSGNAPRDCEDYLSIPRCTINYPAGNKTWEKPRKQWQSFDGSRHIWKAWNPYTTTLTKIKAGKKKATVKWKKNAKATGYQIQYATNKKFTKGKKKLVKGAKKTSTTLKKLKGKKKYYFRVRTYKVDAKKKYYSAWSKAKAVTIKK